MSKRFVIIGTGVAGIAAAEAIRSLDQHSVLTLVGEESGQYYSRPGLAYVLTGEIPEERLFPFDQQDFERLGVEIVGKRAVLIDRSLKQVVMADGQSLPYDRLLIATGAAARRSRAAGADLPGVVTLDNLVEAREIIGRSRKAKRAVVVGGGITALELVEGLLARGVRVHYFLRRDRYWGNVLDELESQIVERRLEEDGVIIHYQTELAEIVGKKSGLFGRGVRQVAGVQTQDGQVIPCDMVAIAIGVIPQVGLAQSSGLEVDRGVLVNEYLQTTDPDIYAAGDVAEVYDPAMGKTAVDSLWGPARDQGWIAGQNMAGKHTPYRRKPPMNVTRLAGLTTTIIGAVGKGGKDDDLVGIIRGDSESWRSVPHAIAVQSNFDVNRVRIVVGSETILGAIVMGDQKLSQPLRDLIGNQVPVGEIRERLLGPDAPLEDIILKFWSATNGKTR